MFTCMVNFFNISTDTTLLSRVRNVKFEMNTLRIKNMFHHYQKTNLMKNKFYVLFAGLKNYRCNKQTQMTVWNYR